MLMRNGARATTEEVNTHDTGLIIRLLIRAALAWSSAIPAIMRVIIASFRPSLTPKLGPRHIALISQGLLGQASCSRR